MTRTNNLSNLRMAFLQGIGVYNNHV
jgi:hypothetical protein